MSQPQTLVEYLGAPIHESSTMHLLVTEKPYHASGPSKSFLAILEYAR